MATGVLASPPILQFFNNTGLVAANGSVLTTVGGINTATYQDVNLTSPLPNPIPLNSRGEISTAAGVTSPCFLTPNVIYTFTLFDGPNGTGNQIWAQPYVPGFLVPSTQAAIGSLLYPVQSVEGGVTPQNLWYAPLDPRRYASIANWATVYAAVSSASDSDWPFYRGDHAQHPTQTNAIVGYKTFDDSQMTGTAGWHCTALGAQALQFNAGSGASAGGTNTAIGYGTLQHNVNGSGNTGVGAEVLNLLTGTLSAHNNCFGYRGCTLLTNGTQNNTFGFTVCTNLTTGNNNHGFGESVMENLQIGTGNHHFGYQNGFTKIGGDFSHSFGYDALFSENALLISGISIAASAVVTVNTVSTINPLSVGCPVEFTNVSGMTQINGLFGTVTAIGGSSGAWTATVNINSSGFSAWTSGGYCSPIGNHVFGYRSGFNIVARGGNTLMGFQTSGDSAEPGTSNSCFGYQAGQALNCNAGLGTADFNVFVGYQAGLRATGANNNVAVGQQSFNTATSATDCVVVGPNAGQAITTSLRNVWVGSVAGVNLNGNNNTGCGYNAGSTASAQTYTSTTSIGANAVPAQSGDFTLGDANVTRLRCQQTAITSLSDERFKTDIRALEISAEAFADLNPIVFRWIAGAGPAGDIMGFIAQELDRWQTKWGLEWMELVTKPNPERWEASPMKLFFPLLKLVQVQEARLKAIEAKLGL